MGETDEPILAPIEATREAFAWMRAFGDSHLEESISAMAERVKAIAPHCIAMSVAVSRGDYTFTLTADRYLAALLDAVQYLDGGPCVEALVTEEAQVTRSLPTDEGQWQMFAAAKAFAGIASTLSFPLMTEKGTFGGVNLYGAAVDAFDGLHEELATVLGAWAGGAVTNADLDFTSRVRAAATPERLRDDSDIEIATGMVAQQQGVGLEEARDRLRQAAVSAGVTEAEFARFIQDSHVSRLG
jgi:GAF domain-containing protein